MKASLPIMMINQNVPNAVVFGPIEYGGTMAIEVYSLQYQVQLPYLLKLLGWDWTVGNNLLVTIVSRQIKADFTSPITENPSLPLIYMGHNWLLGVQWKISEMKMHRSQSYRGLETRQLWNAPAESVKS